MQTRKLMKSQKFTRGFITTMEAAWMLMMEASGWVSSVWVVPFLKSLNYEKEKVYV